MLIDDLRKALDTDDLLAFALLVHDLPCTDTIHKELGGMSLLRYTLENGKSEMAEILFDINAELEPHIRGQSTILHRVASGGYLDCISLLVEKGYAVDVKDSYGWTPLHNASCQNKVECVNKLLHLGAHINEQNKMGWTPLHLSAYNGGVSSVDVLLEYGANIDIEDLNGKKAFDVCKDDQTRSIFKQKL